MFIPKYFILFELFSEFPFLIVHCWYIEMQLVNFEGVLSCDLAEYIY